MLAEDEIPIPQLVSSPEPTLAQPQPLLLEHPNSRAQFISDLKKRVERGEVESLVVSKLKEKNHWWSSYPSWFLHFPYVLFLGFLSFIFSLVFLVFFFFPSFCFFLSSVESLIFPLLSSINFLSEMIRKQLYYIKILKKNINNLFNIMTRSETGSFLFCSFFLFLFHCRFLFPLLFLSLLFFLFLFCLFFFVVFFFLFFSSCLFFIFVLLFIFSLSSFSLFSEFNVFQKPILFKSSNGNNST